MEMKKPTLKVGFFISRTSYDYEIVLFVLLIRAQNGFDIANSTFAQNHKARLDKMDLAKNLRIMR